MALTGGDSRKAIKIFTEANGLLDTWIGRFDLGRAYLEEGAFTEADSEFDRSMKRRGEASALFLDQSPTFGYFPSVHYYTGRVREGLKSPGFKDSYRTYLSIRGLEITGNGGDGVNMSGTLSFITLEDLVIHDIDVGINFRNTMNNITVRRNHIYNTGIGGGTGEGLYVGCNNATCIVSNSLIEQNWVHDSLPGTTQGDGIEVKVGSHSNIVRDNVVYNRAYPGIFVYGTGSNPSSNGVEGYTTNRGTYVQPHQQTSPNGTQYDNYGTRGNVNPYTGNTWTRPPKY